MVANSMLQAIALGRTFVVDATTSAYVHPGRCPGRGLDCLFLPLSKCTLSDAFASGADAPMQSEREGGAMPKSMDIEALRERVGELPRLALPAGDGHPRVISSRTSCFKLGHADANHLLSAVQGRVEAGLEQHDARHIRPSTPQAPPIWWWLQQLSGYVARPTQRVESIATALTHSLGLASGIPYVGMHIRRGDKGSEAQIHKTRVYAAAAAVAHRNVTADRSTAAAAAESAGAAEIFLASDDPEPYRALPGLLPHLRVTWVPHHRFFVSPNPGPIVAAKMVEGQHRRYAQEESSQHNRILLSEKDRAVRDGDEGEVQIAQLLLLARASALVGTLTSNYLLLAYEMAMHLRGGVGELQAPPNLHDLDGNSYFQCSVREQPPWGPDKGRGVRSGI